jgi:hypothetical protein
VIPAPYFIRPLYGPNEKSKHNLFFEKFLGRSLEDYFAGRLFFREPGIKMRELTIYAIVLPLDIFLTAYLVNVPLCRVSELVRKCIYTAISTDPPKSFFIQLLSTDVCVFYSVNF